MNLVAIQQVALDNSLVAPKKRLKIEKCDARIAFSKPQREETYQVTLEDLKLSPCYPAFLITAEVLGIYMHQFWNTITKIRDTDAYKFVALPSEEELLSFIKELGYSGKCNMLSDIHTDQMHQPWRTFAAIINRCISGKTTGLDRLGESRAQILTKPFMRNIINLHTVRNDSLLGTLKFVTKTNDTQKYGALIPDEMINQNIKDSKEYKTYYDFATGKVEPKKAMKFKKVSSPSRILSPVLEAEHVKKAKRVKRPAKKSTTAPTACVVIRDNHGVSVSKKKAPAKADRGKGIELLSDAALLEDAQLKKALRKSRQDTHKLQDSGSRVPDVLKANSSDSDNESWGDSADESDDINDNDNDDDNANNDDSENEDDNGNDAHDSERTNSDDDDENPSFTLKDYDEEEHDEEYESHDDYENVYEEEDDDLYKDVDVRLLGVEQEQERKGDEEITDADQNVSQEKSYEQVIEDAHVTLTSSQKTESLKQSSSVSSDFASKVLILDNVPPIVNEVASMMNVKNVDGLLSIRIGYATRTALQSYTQEFEKKAQEERKLYIDGVEKSVKDIIKDEVKSLLPQILPKEVSNFHHPVLSRFELKKILLDKIEKSKLYQAAPEHRELYAGRVKSYKFDKELFSSYGNISKDAEPPKGSKLKDSKSRLSKGTKSQPKSSGKSVKEEKLVFEVVNSETPQDQGGDTKDQPNVKSLPFIKAQGRQVVPADYFFNNDLEYLKGRSSSRKYTTSTTKTKAAKYGFQFCCFSVSKELSNLEIHVIFDLNVALRMFTRHIVILKWVEDLQLGVESYQKKRNITKPKTFRSGISKRTPYTAYKNPQGIIYQDKLKRNRLMRSDELYKFCDGTLKSVRRVLHDIDSKLSMIYLPKRR
ncbi:hypothetical protein Tco_1482866 [Tanacetum coccineum]